MRANVARMPSNCNLQSYSCFSHQLSLSTVRSKAVQSCLILSTCYEWKIYTFYNSTGQVVSTRQIELSSQNAWLWFTQASASKVVQSYYLYSASAVQSCFYYNTISLFTSVSWMVVYLQIIAAATVQYSIAVLSFSGILAVAAVTPQRS